MSSSVWFKFKSQKDATRVPIDGPHTDVWNLKREIINISRLGDGTDFDLKIYKENSEEEYTDDTELIPKDSTVLARRAPASAPGKGRAARYVSGKPPVTAKPVVATKINSHAFLDAHMTEEERIEATLRMQDEQWKAQQADMSHDTKVGFSGRPITKKANVPDGPPPDSYICYRCRKKGHWIQACPTNDDANFDTKVRIKRTTGIPRSMLKRVEVDNIEDLPEDVQKKLFVDKDGEYVIAKTDEKAWKKFQDEQKAAKMGIQAQAEEEKGDKQLQEAGLECPINKVMFVNPVKTPCCGKTYCQDCIENALIDNDLTCPGCQTENVSLESLVPDTETQQRIKDYTSVKRQNQSDNSAADSPRPDDSVRDGTASPRSPASVNSRKRGASDLSNNLSAPAMKRQKSAESTQSAQPTGSAAISDETATSTNDIGQNGLPNFMQNIPNMAAMPFPMMPGMPAMPMNMPMPFPMMNGMPNMNMPMNMNMMPTMGFSQPMFNNMNGGMNGNNMNNGYNNHSYNTRQGGYNNYNGHRGGYNANGNFQKFNKFDKSRGNGWRDKSEQRNATPVMPSAKPAEGLENVPAGPKAMQNGVNGGINGANANRGRGGAMRGRGRGG